MKMRQKSALLVLAGLCATLISGCQTWVPEAGITVPSPNYLRHFPQYIPPSDPYPLPKELRSLEEAGKQVYDNR